jgi:hypothetical protein
LARPAFLAAMCLAVANLWGKCLFWIFVE